MFAKVNPALQHSIPAHMHAFPVTVASRSVSMLAFNFWEARWISGCVKATPAQLSSFQSWQTIVAAHICCLKQASSTPPPI